MLFTDKQFGLLKGRSTTLQLLQILDKWTECLEHGGQVDVIYTNLEKAFDKIPHRRLISKLHSYCIHNNIHRVSKKLQICICQNFVKFPPILMIFDRKMAKKLKL